MPVITPLTTTPAFARSWSDPKMKREEFLTTEKDTEMETPLRPDISETPLKGVRSNIVQSIRAFRVQDLQDSAARSASTSCMPTWPPRRASRTCWT
jgi:hypothetical protein